MRAHVVFTHPNPKSFNGRLGQTTVDTLRALGMEVTYTDLYALRFNPVAGPGDFTRLLDPDFFDLQREQRHALEQGTFTADIQSEQAFLQAADLIVFHFPFWWYSMPALLKGYFDRVFSVGFAYGGGTALAGKKGLVCTTTGANDQWLNENQPPGSLYQVLHHLLFGTLAFSGMQVLDPCWVYSAKRLSEEQKSEVLQEWEKILRAWSARKVIFQGI